MSDDKRLTFGERLFRSCLWILGSVVLLYVTLLLLANIWLWLVLLLGIAAMTVGTVWLLRWRRNRW